jgi:hypothetical protein
MTRPLPNMYFGINTSGSCIEVETVELGPVSESSASDVDVSKKDLKV